jgi:hypothetical protein
LKSVHDILQSVVDVMPLQIVRSHVQADFKLKDILGLVSDAAALLRRYNRTVQLVPP